MTTPITDRPAALDSAAHVDSQAYRYELIFALGRRVLRVRVKRDHYPQQSYATGEMLSDVGTWIRMLSEPVESWYPGTPTHTLVTSTVGGVPGQHTKVMQVLEPTATAVMARLCSVVAHLDGLTPTGTTAERAAFDAGAAYGEAKYSTDMDSDQAWQEYLAGPEATA
jgi:hypothetical protein